MKRIFCCIALLTWFVSSPATASIQLFNIDSDLEAWNGAIAGLQQTASYNFDEDTIDYGSSLGANYFFGPLTNMGNEFVSAGILPEGMTIGTDTSMLQTIASDAAPMNSSNAVLEFPVTLGPGFQDAFVIDFSAPVSAFEFNVLSIDGNGALGGGVGPLVNIQVSFGSGMVGTFQNVLTNGALGSNLGLLAHTGESITRIEISGVNQFTIEGIQGAGSIYGMSMIPEPSSLICWSLLGFLGVACRRRKSIA